MSAPVWTSPIVATKDGTTIVELDAALDPQTVAYTVAPLFTFMAHWSGGPHARTGRISIVHAVTGITP